jgi:hypothetical protein
MGINSLSFRDPQHRAFFDLDTDRAPVRLQLRWDRLAI